MCQNMDNFTPLRLKYYFIPHKTGGAAVGDSQVRCCNERDNVELTLQELQDGRDQNHTVQLMV